jgi:hypothetical protein
MEYECLPFIIVYNIYLKLIRYLKNSFIVSYFCVNLRKLERILLYFLYQILIFFHVNLILIMFVFNSLNLYLFHLNLLFSIFYIKFLEEIRIFNYINIYILNYIF